MELSEFERWLIEVGDGEARGDEVIVTIPGYQPVMVRADDEILHALLPELERDAMEAWASSSKPARVLAMQLLSAHIDEILGSNVGSRPTRIVLTADGFRPEFD
ncbi:hypothetical protein [uncultured Curtobacterium sp.]|uniref:hypothetical protein n=1 Tax=uncultured Curtobacterium sp. TaxID=331964 RepID=UPI0025903008|nr:hypothetical protein [uncultured Curtobacterium sp.]